METKFLFSYGSNDEKQLGDRLGRPIIEVKKAKVIGYKRIFTNSDYSKDNGGVATLKYTGNDTDDVLGYVTKLTENEFKILDLYEGVANFKYKRIQIKVIIKDNQKKYTIHATAYVMTKHFLKRESIGYLKPTDEYLEKVAKTINTGGWRRHTGMKFTKKDIPLNLY